MNGLPRKGNKNVGTQAINLFDSKDCNKGERET